MEVIGIIPARYGSSRFEGKVLAPIAGKPMVQHVWESAKNANILDDLIIACDDERIKQAAEKFNAKVFLTAKGHLSGTDRICEIVNPLDVKVVVNIQADEPLIQPVMIESVARALLDDSSLAMATLKKRIMDKNELSDPNTVKVVTDRAGLALYFSRACIPNIASSKPVDLKETAVFKHIGLYAYTKDFLFTFKNLPVSNLEIIERLEQLRVLEAGYKIKVIETNLETIGVDTPEDLEKVKKALSRKS